jgi:hypothetical protein
VRGKPAAVRRLFGPGLDALPAETARLLDESLRNETAVVENAPLDRLFVIRVPGEDLRVYVETFDEPVPGRQVVPIVHGSETYEIPFVDADEP